MTTGEAKISPLLISRGNRPRHGEVRKCGYCGQEIYVMKCFQREINYCSTKCYHAGCKTGDKVKCFTCGRVYYRTKSFQLYQKKRGNKKNFCSRECYAVDMKGRYVGEKSPNYREGSRRDRTGYWSVEYKEWRKAVFERDGYLCQECGFHGYLHAHHIKGYAHHPDLRYEVSNGVTLCKNCHKTKHGEILKNRKPRKSPKAES